MAYCIMQLPLRGLGGLPLGLQVGIFTLIGVAFLGGAAIGCARVFSSTEGFQGRDWIGWALIVIGVPVGLALYSLAALGDWRSAFWLCEPYTYGERYQASFADSWS